MMMMKRSCQGYVSASRSHRFFLVHLLYFSVSNGRDPWDRPVRLPEGKKRSHFLLFDPDPFTFQGPKTEPFFCTALEGHDVAELS